MKFLEILIPFIIGQGKALFDTGTQSMTRQIANNARKFGVLLALTTIFIALFCIGFSMTFSSVINSLQSTNDEWLKPGIIGGGALCLLAACGLVYSLGEKRWMKALGADEEPEAEAKSEPSPIESAVAVLILEFTRELRERREKSPNQKEAS